jgi:hypothetical protein
MAVFPQVEQFGRLGGGAIRVDRDRSEPSRTSPL